MNTSEGQPGERVRDVRFTEDVLPTPTRLAPSTYGSDRVAGVTCLAIRAPHVQVIQTRSPSTPPSSAPQPSC